MAENILTETLSSNPNVLENTSDRAAFAGRPTQIPEKFWDPKNNSIRIDALLKSYLELEKRLSQPSMPDRSAVMKMMGVPEKHEDYCINCDHGLFDADDSINERMHKLGFTPEQAQFVYDLGAERMLPLARDMAAQFQAEQEIERLKNHFGGEDKWRDMARQILAWARRNLPPAAMSGLATTFDGVMAMYGMMTNGAEVATFGRQGSPVGEDDPASLIKDPRYWRDRDPGFIAKVTEGFQRKYKNES